MILHRPKSNCIQPLSWLSSPTFWMLAAPARIAEKVSRAIKALTDLPLAIRDTTQTRRGQIRASDCFVATAWMPIGYERGFL